jgi:hypothetical protein
MHHLAKIVIFNVNLTKYPIHCFFLSFAAWASALPGPVADDQPSPAREGVQYRLQLSPYAHHWAARAPEDRDAFLLGIEREHANGKLDGIAFFSNTFGQESLYIFPWGGVYKNIYGISKLSFKWTAGLIYGYKPPFEGKVPFNVKGFAPGIIPALTYDFSSKWSGQLNLLGTQGVMVQINVPLN